MFTPWQPFADVQLDMPELRLALDGTSLTVDWDDSFGKGASFRVKFTGIASLLVVDESTYASAPNVGLPRVSQFAPVAGRCYLWRECDSPRKSLYGDLGALGYRRLDTYYFSGGNIIFLLDVADCTPEVVTPPPNNRWRGP